MVTHTPATCPEPERDTTVVGNYVVYEDTQAPDALQWKVAVLVDGAREPSRPLAGFSEHALAMAFVLSNTNPGDEAGARPGAARPRVLAVAEAGFIRLCTTSDVDAVVVDLRVRQAFQRSELLPVHDGFAPMLEHLGIDWPVSPHGRRSERMTTAVS